MPGCRAVDYSLLVKIANGTLARSPLQYIPLDLGIFREVMYMWTAGGVSDSM